MEGKSQVFALVLHPPLALSTRTAHHVDVVAIASFILLIVICPAVV